MSVIVITRFQTKASEVERVAATKRGETMRRIADDAKAQGAVHHMFAEDEDGNVMVVDEWSSEAAFRSFFDGKDAPSEARDESSPSSAAYRVLDTPDRF
jgi:heme-degrading monooxygenase HmoA